MHIDDKDKDGQEVETTITADSGDPLEPIEIDVGDGTDKEGTDAAKPKKKGDGRLQRRLNTLTAQKAEAETTAQRLARENEELRQKLTETTERAQVADKAALANYEESIKANLANARKALAEAQASGDPDKVADATIEAGKWASESQRLESWKRANPEPPARDDDDDGEPEPKRTRPQQTQQPSYTPELKQFLQDNPWFVPGTKDNPNPEFDLEMHQFARSHGLILEQRYKRAGKPIDQSYYDQLVADTKAEFGVDDDDDDVRPAPKRGVPKMNGDATVAPARSSQAAADGARGGTGTKVVLNAEQRAFAWSMADNGAYKNPDGTPLTRQQAEVRYAKALHRDQQQRKGA